MTATLLTHALHYSDKGLSVIPCKPREKVPDLPAWACFTHERASRATIETWWKDKPQRNIGVVTGEVSGGLVVLDFDAIPAFQAYCSEFPDLLDTRIHLTGSGHGYHCFYYVSIIPQSAKYLTSFGRVEVKANGVQIVAPPSIHPTGNTYRVHFRSPTARIKDLSAVIDWLKLHEHKPQPIPALPVSSSIHPNLSRATNDLLTNGASEGERSDRLFKAACDMSGNGIGLVEAESRLLTATSLPEREARRTIASAYQKQRVPARPAQRSNGTAEQALAQWRKATGRS